MTDELTERRGRLLDLGFSELEIADVSAEGLEKIRWRLRGMGRTELDWKRRGSSRFVPRRLKLIEEAKEQERVMRHAFNLTLDQLIGREISRARVRSGHSVDWLANEMACSHQRIEDIEAGAISLTTAMLSTIAKLLAVSLVDLKPTEMRRRLLKPAPASPAPAGQSPRNGGSPPHSSPA